MGTPVRVVYRAQGPSYWAAGRTSLPRPPAACSTPCRANRLSPRPPPLVRVLRGGEASKYHQGTIPLMTTMDVHNVGNTAFWTLVPLVYCTTHPEDASGILHFWSGSEASLASRLDR
eukprot:1195932-Prorocentrum_minimum.AAC.4